MAALMSSGKGKRTADRPYRALSGADGHRWSAILPHLQHGRRTLPVGGPDGCGSRGAQHRSIDPGRSWSIINRMRRSRLRGTATSAIWNTVYGLAKKHYVNVPRSREAEHEVIVYCKANPAVKVIKAIGLTFDKMRKERGIVMSK